MSSVNEFFWGNWVPGTETHPRESFSPHGNDLDKDAFLRLMIAQLQHQDPLDPVSDKEFVAQLAQFTALEQMQNMNKSMQHQTAFSMIGKLISGRTFSEAQSRFVEVAGRVDSVVIRGGEAFLIVGDNEVAMNNVDQIIEDPRQMWVWQSINNNVANSQTMALIGQNVQAIKRGEDDKALGFVEGKVEFVRFNNGIPMLVIGDNEIFPSEVIAVSGDKPLLQGQPLSILVSGQLTSGKITGINIADEKAFVQIEDLQGGRHQAEIGAIDVFTEAIRSIGRNVTGTIVTGTGVETEVRNIEGNVKGVVVGSNARVYVTVETANEDGSTSQERVLFEHVRTRRE
jgi:flagellar hook assembly protein FlgD